MLLAHETPREKAARGGHQSNPEINEEVVIGASINDQTSGNKRFVFALPEPVWRKAGQKGPEFHYDLIGNPKDGIFIKIRAVGQKRTSRVMTQRGLEAVGGVTVAKIGLQSDEVCYRRGIRAILRGETIQLVDIPDAFLKPADQANKLIEAKKETMREAGQPAEAPAPSPAPAPAPATTEEIPMSPLERLRINTAAFNASLRDFGSRVDLSTHKGDDGTSQVKVGVLIHEEFE